MDFHEDVNTTAAVILVYCSLFGTKKNRAQFERSMCARLEHTLTLHISGTHIHGAPRGGNYLQSGPRNLPA